MKVSLTSARRFFAALLLMLGGVFAEEVDPSTDTSMQELEEKITELKNEVTRAKAQLLELEGAVLRGKITGAKALITFENNAEGTFALVTGEFRLDGELVYKINTSSSPEGIRKATVFEGEVPSGEHRLEIALEYSGGEKPPFSYFRGHRFFLKSTEQFSVDYGKTTQLKLTVLDKGYFKADFGERLVLKSDAIPDWGQEPPE